MRTRTPTAKEFIAEKNLKFCKDADVWMKDIARKGRHLWKRDAWTFEEQPSMPDKVFLIERLLYERPDGNCHHRVEPGSVQYRICYWIVGRNGRVNGKWTFGQFCPIIPASDLHSLLKAARKKAVIRLADWPS